MKTNRDSDFKDTLGKPSPSNARAHFQQKWYRNGRIGDFPDAPNCLSSHVERNSAPQGVIIIKKWGVKALQWCYRQKRQTFREAG